MARMARLVVPDVPHHVTQRGNRRQTTFFREGDYESYKTLMAEWCAREGVDVWAYCLMPNHVHLIVVPSGERSLRGAIGEAHRRYTRLVNLREGWRGCLWQGRFFSYPMDAAHLYNAARYVEQNPVRAGLVPSPAAWPHSSARAHLARQDDMLVRWRPLGERFEDWDRLLAADLPRAALGEARRHTTTGRPLGSPQFVAALELTAGRPLQPRAPGRPLARPSEGAARLPRPVAGAEL